MLPCVEVVVTTTERVENLVRSALYDIACLNDENLVRPTNGLEPVCDHERRSSLHQMVEAVLDHRLGL